MGYLFDDMFEPNPDPLYGAEPLEDVTLSDFREDLPPMPKVGRRARVVECEANSFDELRRTPAFLRGKLDYREGKQGPGEHGGRVYRAAWWLGWLEARTQERLGAIFAKYGI